MSLFQKGEKNSTEGSKKVFVYSNDSQHTLTLFKSFDTYRDKIYWLQ